MHCLPLLLPGLHQSFCNFGLLSRRQDQPGTQVCRAYQNCLLHHEMLPLGAWWCWEVTARAGTLCSFIPPTGLLIILLNNFDWQRHWVCKLCWISSWGAAQQIKVLLKCSMNWTPGTHFYYFLLILPTVIFKPSQQSVFVRLCRCWHERDSGRSFILWVFPVWFYCSFLYAWGINIMSFLWTGVLLGDEISLRS